MVQIQYFGDYNFYKVLVNDLHADFLLYQTYQKSAHLNRTVISGANGVIKLNIPLVGGREQRLPLASVRVNKEENWRRIHLRSIISSYRRSPWFDHFADELSEFYSKDFELLWQWNISSIRWIANVLKLNLQIREVYEKQPADLTEAEQYRSEQRQEAPLSKPYPQVFEDRFGFIPGLSILDTLFCLGPKSTREYIMRG